VKHGSGVDNESHRSCTGEREGGVRHDIDPDESSEGDRVSVDPALADAA